MRTIAIRFSAAVDYRALVLMSGSLILIGFCSGSTPVTLNAAVPQDETEVETLDEIGKNIRLLSANEFVSREKAMRRLIEMSPDSIARIQSEIQTLDAEGTQRAIVVLRSIAQEHAPEHELTLQIRAILRELELLKVPRFSGPAARTLDFLDQWTERQTITQFQKEGARIVRRQTRTLNGTIASTVDSITLDDNWTGEVETIDRLKYLVSIRRVTMIGKRFGNSAVSSALKLPKLSSLTLKDVQFDGSVFKELLARPSLPPLQILEIKYCPVEDASIDFLSQIKTLQLVMLYGTEVSIGGALRLEAALPAAEVDRRAGGFLGVRCTIDGPCTVSSVEQGSAAELAGLKVGDLITQFNGVPVVSMDELIAEIGKAKVDEKVTVQFKRGEEERQVELELGRWD